MADFDGAFFIENHGGGIVIFHFDVEDGAANRDHRAGRANFVVIGQAAGVFNLDADFAEPDFEEIAPVAAIGPEDDFRFGEDFKSTAVGNLENAVAVNAGYDDLFGLDQIADVEGPGGVVFEDGKLAGPGKQFRGTVQGGLRRGRLGREAHAQTPKEGQRQKEARNVAKTCHCEHYNTTGIARELWMQPGGVSQLPQNQQVGEDGVAQVR